MTHTPESLAAHQWDVKCRAMFLALHAASNLARDIGMDVEEMLRVYLLRTDRNAPAAVLAVQASRKIP